ncbi:MAG: GntR family transcriptional regulator, partial [Clostridiales bacterium]|nr:GntR family transcriptional regulator [Clostridiales bacterium]
MINKSKPLTAMVYDHIYTEIVNGNLTSNDILTEGALTQKLEVSKSPVREALIMLCEENVLQAIPRTGYKVIQITPVQVASLIEARDALEPFLLEKAWPKMEEAQINQLVEHYQWSKKDELIHTTIQDNWYRNISFHMLLASFAGNDYLLEALH